MMKQILIGMVFLSAASPGFAGDRSGPGMATAATHLLAALTDSQRAACVYAFDAEERSDFHFIPKSSRKGVSIEAMSPTQLHLTHVLLNESLSHSGYSKAAGIMCLEEVLAEIELAQGRAKAREHRNPMKYFVTLFGEPTPQGTWGWSFEGHHLSLNFAVVDGQVVASSPAFLGTNPHQVRQGPLTGLRVLGAEEDRARELLASLNRDQCDQAILAAQAPHDIFSGARARITPEAPRGVAGAALSPPQIKLLRRLIDTYIDNVPAEAADERRAQVDDAGTDIHFAWMGSQTVGEAHYYRIQGPTFLIEYDNIQNGANHAHTVWREYDGDFGRDLIGEHRTAHAH